MTCSTVVAVNIGGPVPLNVTGARRGSRWRLVMLLSHDEAGTDPMDLTDVTDVTATIKAGAGSDSIEPTWTLTPDLTNKASGVIVLEVPRDQTDDGPAGDYVWEFELTAPGNADLDGWAPARGLWPVMDRRTGSEGS